MEFRRGSLERRQGRRVCVGCRKFCGTAKKCSKCGKRTAARIQVNWYVGGKRYRELTGLWREDDAVKVLERKEADYWRRQDLGAQRDVGGTLREAADSFTAELSDRSRDYRKQIKTSLNLLGELVGWDRPVQLIGMAEICQFKEDGLALRSSSTVRSYMLVLRRFFGHLLDEGWIRKDPTRRVKLPRAVGRKDHLRPAEVGPVLDAFWRISPEIAPIATTLVLGGWRKGEIVNLRRSDADLTSGWAYVVDFAGDELLDPWSPKTESSVRAVPLHALVIRAMERTEPVTCPDGRESPWMFPVVDRRKRKRRRDRLGRAQPVLGDRRSPDTTFFGPKLDEALAAAGIRRKVTIHGLRRTFAVLLQEVGAPDSIIRQALGHGQRSVTELNYLPRRDEAVKRWVDKIDLSISALDVAAVSPPAPTGAPTGSTSIEPSPPALPAPAAVQPVVGQRPDRDSHCHQSATNWWQNGLTSLPRYD